jgi:hypothetical protein
VEATRASIRSNSPARRARRFKASIIFGCTSTAMTRPVGPTSRASSSVKKSHSRSGLEDGHSCAHKGGEDAGGVMRDLTDRLARM